MVLQFLIASLLSLLPTVLGKAIKGAGLLFIAQAISTKLLSFLGIFTDADKDNDKQMKSFLKTEIATFPATLAEGVLEHTPHKLSQDEADRLKEISQEYGLLYAKAIG